MFSKIKNIFSNIKSFINDLIHGNLLFGQATESGVAANRNKQAGSTLLDNASYDQDDLYGYYNSLGPGALQSLYNKQTEAGLTGQQMALNEMQMDNQRRQYAFQVQGMHEAGLNPALMYQSGAQSAPSAPAPTQGASMSDLVQLILADKQAKLLDAQAGELNTRSDKNAADTEHMRLVNQYYPTVTQTDIDKSLSEIGVNEQSVEKMRSEVRVNELDADLKAIDKVIRSAEARESSAYYKAVREFQEASTDKAKAEKGQILVRTAMDELEREWMSKTGTKMSSSSVLAIIAYLNSVFKGLSTDVQDLDIGSWFKNWVYDSSKEPYFNEWLRSIFGDDAAYWHNGGSR